MTQAATEDRSAPSPEIIQRLIAHIETVFVGKREVLRLAVTALLAHGHLLLEDVPGVGKTTLAQALARSVGARFQRIQFTSDLLPADILGTSIFDRDTQTFELKRGPIFANVVLADEINRTTPRTQSALLEAMAERRVSIDNTTHPLPNPFLVLATQNPLEFHGTYPLPESQLDRFLMRLSIGYPGAEIERKLLLARRTAEPVESLAALIQPEDLVALQARVDHVRFDDSLADYAMRLIEATRTSRHIAIGVSTRGALALVRAARAHALVHSRDYCIPDDIARLAAPVLAHRLTLSGPARGISGDRREAEAIVEELLSTVEVPL